MVSQRHWRVITATAALVLVACAPTPGGSSTPSGAVENARGSTLPSRPAATPSIGLRAGMLVDIARRYWQPKSLQALTEDIAAAGGNFLHLHLSDDENYGIESTVLGQTPAGAVRGADGAWTNPRTGKRFLSYAQIRSLDTYAAAHGVELILEVDAPGHMRGIRNLLKTNPTWATSVRNIFSPDSSSDLNLASQEGQQLVLALDAEVARIVPHSAHQHLGGDEFPRPAAGDSRFAGFVTARVQALVKRGITAQLWNDSITPMTLATLPPNLEVTYWNYHDFGEDDTDERVTAPQLLKAGFRVLNYCGYYLYTVPGGKADTAASRAQTIATLRSDWTLGTWAQGRTTSASGIAGAAVSIWGEDAGTLSDKAMIARGFPLFKALTEVLAHR